MPAAHPVQKLIRAWAHRKPIYNDKRMDGSRSIKVVGWSEGRALRAANALRELGYNVEVRVYHNKQVYPWIPRLTIRLWVK
jgi:rhodanese-related sulfurtransferase